MKDFGQKQIKRINGVKASKKCNKYIKIEEKLANYYIL